MERIPLGWAGSQATTRCLTESRAWASCNHREGKPGRSCYTPCGIQSPEPDRPLYSICDEHPSKGCMLRATKHIGISFKSLKSKLFTNTEAEFFGASSFSDKARQRIPNLPVKTHRQTAFPPKLRGKTWRRLNLCMQDPSCSRSEQRTYRGGLIAHRSYTLPPICTSQGSVCTVLACTH